MTSPDRRTFVAVFSHRGGAMTSTAAAGLAWQMAALGRPTVLVDCTSAGGAWFLGGIDAPGAGTFDSWDGKTGSARVHERLPLTTVHAARPPRTREEATLLAEGFGLRDNAVVIADLPVCGRPEFEVALRPADLALVVMPSDGVALRSAVAFLQCIQEVRAMPGRAFRIKALLTGTGIRSEERIAIDRFAQKTLAPLLCGAQIPFDPDFRRLIGAGKPPEMAAADSAVASNLTLLARETMQTLGIAGRAAA